MSRLLALAEQIADRASGEEQVEAFVVHSSSTSVRAYEGEVEALEQAESSGVGVRVVVEGREGFAYAGTLAPDAVEVALEEARDNAAFGGADPANGLAEPDGVDPADLELYHQALASTPTDTKVTLALELERSTRAHARISGVRIAEYGDTVGESAVATSTGIRAASRATSCHLAVLALADDGASTQTGYGWSLARDVEGLDVAAAASDAAERAVAKLGSRKAESQKVTAVLEPRVTGAFLGTLGAGLSGEAVLKGRSPFADRLGEQVAAPEIVVVDDPTDARSHGAARFDAEGLASRRTSLVEGGVLQAFLHNTWSARKAGTRSTASAVRGYASTPAISARALALEPGPLDHDALLADVGEGFLVESVSGLHSGVNPVSGDFSVGATGFMIRGGERAEPVREVTIGSTLQRMLRDVVAVGGDLEWLPGGTGAVTLAVADVSLSGS